MLAIELPSDTEEMFQAVSRKTGRPMKALVQEALDRFLEEWEDRQDAMDADRLYSEFKESGERGFPFDEVIREMGLTRGNLA